MFLRKDSIVDLGHTQLIELFHLQANLLTLS